MFEIGDKVTRVARHAFGAVHPAESREIVDIRNNMLILYGSANFKHDPAHYVLTSEYGKMSTQSKPAGRKDDSAKLDMTLFDDMPLALSAVCEVMQWAITKKEPVPYERGSWLGVHADRYRAAIARHNVAAAQQANNPAYPNVEARFQLDDETKLLHLSHIACSALMALENTLREMQVK